MITKIINIKSLVLIVTMIVLASPISAQKYNNGLIDKTVAMIGNDMVMLSQIESEVQMLSFQGYTGDKNLRCQILEQMLVSKLFLTQARLDSLSVSEDMVNAQLEERLSNALTQLGGESEVERYFGKSLYKLRQEWRETLREQSLTQNMQQKVSQSVTGMTPRQVEAFYKRIPKDSLPIIPTQYKLSQIVLYPDTEAAALLVKERLIGFRERILAGEKFQVLAAMYSQDPGSALKGGELGLASKSIFWSEFGDAAMSLQVGQVSPIVETPDGFHILQLLEKQGDMINVRHILLKPKYTQEDKNKAFGALDSLRTKILEDSILFTTAARYYSQDLKSRTNGGVVADENTGSVLFEKDQLKPADYMVLKDMKVGDISKPIESTDNEGRSGNLIYKIIKLEELIPSHNATFEKDFQVLQNVASQQQSMKAIEAFILDKQKTTYIVIDPLFHNCQFDREGWFK